jgi:hypothetical protein
MSNYIALNPKLADYCTTEDNTKLYPRTLNICNTDFAKKLRFVGGRLGNYHDYKTALEAFKISDNTETVKKKF